jgi:hypothetical protein
MKNPRYPLWGALCTLITAAHCAPVTWTAGPTSVDAQNENSINLTGTLFHAGSWGSGGTAAPITVTLPSGSITFENLTPGNTLGTLNAVATGGEFGNNDLWIPTGTADPGFLSVMRGMNPDGPNPKVVSVGRLVVGKQYQIQLFTSDDRGCCNGRTQEWSDNATDGVGAETATFTMGSSSYVTGTFTANATSQNFYLRGVAQSQNGVSAYVLRDLSPDTDGDGIPDHVEIPSPLLNENNAADAQADPDADDVINLIEYQKGLDMNDSDTDNDGLSDGEEVNTYFTNPKVTDTDGDTLSDSEEFDFNGNPLLSDTDGDFFPDGYEKLAGTQLDNSASSPGGLVITNAGGLLGGDLTDPENDINDSTPAGANFNWVEATASSKASFAADEAAFNVFDNKVGGGEAKWCCDGANPSQHVTVQFAQFTRISHFTITSQNDDTNFDPRVWEIQGSNDGNSFATIARIDYSNVSIWTGRSQTLRVDLPVPSLPYKYIRYTFFRTGGGAHALNELEYFGTQSNTDGDGDGMPLLYEQAYDTFLSDSVPGDAAADKDGDTLSNLTEFTMGTRPDLADTDGDGLNDNLEAPEGANPLIADTDGDGLSDGQEVTLGTLPNSPDTDGDNYRDAYEVNAGSDPTDFEDTPGGVTITSRGTGAGALIGGDITDHENNGNDSTNLGSGFDWASITATSNASFSPQEGAFNVFDNKLGGGEAKWCCDPAPQSITVQMPASVALTHFTIASSNDSAERDPRVFTIQGSNNGVSFTDIFSYNDPGASLWSTRDQVLEFTLPAPAANYTYLRYSVTGTGSAMHALGEIEFFGNEGSVSDTDGDGMPNFWEIQYGLNPGSNADATTDLDTDGLNNLAEYLAGTIPNDNDTDDDQLPDGAEGPAGGNPLDPDTDDDTLPDGPEVNTYGSRPDLRDTDGDNFSDPYEVARATNPNNPASTPFGATIQFLGTGTGALLGRDVTDRDNNGSDATLAGSGFDWTSITATSKPDFAPAEGAFNVFDNKVGGGEAKWCCDPPPASITVQLPYNVRLTHFTVTSSNDSPARDPRIWAVQGSNDGVTFTDIYTHLDGTGEVWTARDQVARFNLAATAPAYTWFRFQVTSTGGNQVALGEIEYFGLEQDTDNDGLPDYYEVQNNSFLSPTNAADALLDADGDGLNNLAEFQNRTNPLLSDSDNDGLGDNAEVTGGSNPLLADTDGDQISDGAEVHGGSSPVDANSLPNFPAIDWGTPGNITGNLTDFNTTGQLIHAWTGGGAAVNVPGVGNFVPGPSLGARETAVDPYVRANPAYDTLLDSASSAGQSRFLEIRNLLPGQSYRIQVWLADTRPGFEGRSWTIGTYDLADESVTLESGEAGNEVAKPGQFVTGTFTASYETQYIYLEGITVNGAQYNAVTVHMTSVPPQAVKVTSIVRVGGSIQITVTNLDTTKNYRLRRSSPTLTAFADLGAAFKPNTATQVLTDNAPPPGKAFYIIQDVP